MICLNVTLNHDQSVVKLLLSAGHRRLNLYQWIEKPHRSKTNCRKGNEKACYFSTALFHMNVNEAGANSFPSSHISKIRGNTCFIRKLTKEEKPLGFSDIFQDFVLPSSFLYFLYTGLLILLAIFCQAAAEKVLSLN